MPFLRFARDKRGYETTALVHAYRGRQGRARQKVLYWFRTPPNVKVGRPALDQEAIRWIEEHNPDIEFDWPKILEATPPPAAFEDPRGRRPRRDSADRRERGSDRRSAQRAAPSRRIPETAPIIPPPEEQPAIQAPEEEALEQITHPDAEPAPAQTLSAAESVLGREQLIRFRARYAELQARIIERGGEPARVEEMRVQAEALNPDSWVTLEEARTGLEQFEPKIRELRDALGLKRRRRSRRGGRRRRTAGQTTSAGLSSNPQDSEELQDSPNAEATGAPVDADAEDAADPEDKDEGGAD